MGLRFDDVSDGTADPDCVDIEGAEFLVLEGMERGEKGSGKKFLIELHDMGNKTELELCLHRYNYRSDWIDVEHLLATARSLSSHE